eukprot:2077836-Rhodomonas_salina.2
MKPRTDTPFLLPKDSEAQPLYKNEDPGVRTDLRYVQGLRFVTALWILVNHFLSNDDLPEWATNLIFARPGMSNVPDLPTRAEPAAAMYGMPGADTTFGSSELVRINFRARNAHGICKKRRHRGVFAFHVQEGKQ